MRKQLTHAPTHHYNPALADSARRPSRFVYHKSRCGVVPRLQRRRSGDGHNCIGHNYVGHSYIGQALGDASVMDDLVTPHNYIGHSYIGQNYIGHKYICHDYISLYAIAIQVTHRLRTT